MSPRQAKSLIINDASFNCSVRSKVASVSQFYDDLFADLLGQMFVPLFDSLQRIFVMHYDVGRDSLWLVEDDFSCRIVVCIGLRMKK